VPESNPEQMEDVPPLTWGPRREGFGEGEDLRLRLLERATAHADVAAREAAAPPLAHRVPAGHERDRLRAGRPARLKTGGHAPHRLISQRRQAAEHHDPARGLGKGEGIFFPPAHGAGFASPQGFPFDARRLDPKRPGPGGPRARQQEKDTAPATCGLESESSRRDFVRTAPTNQRIDGRVWLPRKFFAHVFRKNNLKY
jgi:hypothetical protein